MEEGRGGSINTRLENVDGIICTLLAYLECVMAETPDQPAKLKLATIKPWVSHSKPDPDPTLPKWAYPQNSASLFRSKAMIDERVDSGAVLRYGLRLRDLRWNGEKKAWEMTFVAGKDETVSFSRGAEENKWRITTRPKKKPSRKSSPKR